MIKNFKEIEYLENKTPLRIKTRKQKRARKIKLIKFIFILSLIIAGYIFISNKIKEFNSPVYIEDRYIDCVNLGDCEDLTSDEISIEEKETAPKGTSKLGEVVVHKGVYINSAILEAIDKKFSPAEAKKLKVIMLAECAKDYKIDGVATYECKSTTENYNPDSKTYDCGYFQISSKEKCSQKHFSIDYQISKAYDKLHSLNNENCGGWNCWSSYKFRNSTTFKTSYNYWANR